MNVIELFAGAGGAALGLEAAGCESLARVEIEPDPCETMRAAGLECIEGDVRDLSYYEGLQADLVWSSFPCQIWSTAGGRKGAKDEKRNGWPWTLEAIDFIEPKWFIAENVTGLTSHSGGCSSGCLGPEDCARAYFDLEIVAPLRERFAWVGWRILNAADFGVPQFRRRVFIVAGTRAIRWPDPTHGDPKAAKQGDLFGRRLKPWSTVRDALGAGGSVIQYGVATKPNGRTKEMPTDGPSGTLLGGGRMYIGDSLGAGSYLRTEMTGAVAASVDEPAGTVAHSGNQYLHATDPGVRKRRAATEIRVIGEGRNPHGRRRLTVEECAILQDFPVGHPFQGTKTAQYRQVGNAVPPKLAEVVGLAVLQADKEKS